jgi:WS/DGAT/MGAT family acyltransferase
MKRLRKELDVKINDLVLAVVAGATRSYVQALGEPADTPMTAMIAVSTRVADDPAHESGNSVAAVPVVLPIHIADPLERVRTVHASTSAAKEMLSAVRARTIQSLGEVAPPLLINLASRAMNAANLSAVMPTMGSMMVSNIPGPPIPLYTCGAKVKGIWAASVLMFNSALNITLMSYQDRMDFGFTVDPDVVADPWRLAEALTPALAELLKAAGLGDPTPIEDPFSG